MFGSFGSTRIWLKYIGRWFSFDMNVHVLPLSIDLQTPAHCGFGRLRCRRRVHRHRPTTAAATAPPRDRRAARAAAGRRRRPPRPRRRLAPPSAGSLSGATSICA